MGTMELSKVTSKTSSIKALLLKAWRERWTDLQWGIHIKTILPRGVSGDVYNLADCILQQALIGPGPNNLVLSYLKHSLSSQLVSYAALLQHISKYTAFHKPHCVLSLLELLEACQAGMTCRGRTEEGILATSMLSLVLWLLQCYHYYSTNSLNKSLEILQKSANMLESMVNSRFTITMLYLAKHEEKEVYGEILRKCKDIEQLNELPVTDISPFLKKLQKIDLNLGREAESVTYCLQPLLSVELAINPSCETAYLVNKLLLLQRLKEYSNARLYCEIMRACLISLNNVLGTSEESQWGAFTFLKLPHIFKQLHWTLKDDTTVSSSEHSQDIVDAFDLLLKMRPLLDIVDTKGYCNFVECLLNELLKVNVISAKHMERINEHREAMSAAVQKPTDPALQPTSIPKVIVRAEPTLPRLLRTLDTDNIKMENLLSILGQVLTGKSFELILAVATVEGKLRIFVQKLLKFNETYVQPVAGENLKQAQHRALLFDLSFLMLCSIVNAYGTQVILPEEGGTTFFENWLRNCMVKKGHPKPPDSFLNVDDHLKVEALLSQLNSTEEFKFSQVRWDQTCLTIPTVIQEVLLAWEQDALTANDVKRILDTMRANICCLPICATAFLCSYMQLLQQDALLKPMNMVQQFLAPVPPGEDTPDCFRSERFALMSQIIRRMQLNICPASSKVALQHGIISNTPISTQLESVWNKFHKQGWITVDATHQLQSLFATGGPSWFIKNVLKEVFKYRYQEELNRAVDLAFATFHLDIEKCTLALLLDVLPQYLHNSLQCDILVEPQLSALAKLSVYCLFSAAQNPAKDVTGKKRSRKTMEAEDSDLLYPASKLLKMSSHEAVSFGTNTSSTKTAMMSSTLQSACNELFNSFLTVSNRDGEISQQTHFVYKFLEMMTQCGGERARLLLQGQPLDNLMPNLIRWMPDMLSVELIASLYDVTTISGRRAAARDLCILTNLQASTMYKV